MESDCTDAQGHCADSAVTTAQSLFYYSAIQKLYAVAASQLLWTQCLILQCLIFIVTSIKTTLTLKLSGVKISTEMHVKYVNQLVLTVTFSVTFYHV